MLKIAFIVVGEGVTNEEGEDNWMEEEVVIVEMVGEGVMEIEVVGKEECGKWQYLGVEVSLGGVKVWLKRFDQM